MAELRALLLSPEQREIARLKRRLEDPVQLSEAVAGVLAEAVVLRARQDDALRRALAPLVAEILQEAVRRDPQPMAQALFPAMGPAIRRAVRAALESMTQSLNRVLTRGLSPRAMMWRIEGWRSGRPFAEVVLLHTLVYRVERVLLVHRESGLLLREVVAPGIDATDGDVIAGMMTATSDFMGDAFGADRDDAACSLAVGDLTVWIEQGPGATLAAVVRGIAPGDLRTTLSEALEATHARMAGHLEEFSGEVAPFALLDDLLEGCLDSEYR
jgi:OOP family OmpA-OmpF porin